MKSLFFLFVVSLSFVTNAQFSYEASTAFPFGRPNPESPPEILDYQLLIGECDCTSSQRKQDGSWPEPEKMLWRFKYIMNGTAIQDETVKTNGGHSGSIRQFAADSSRWYVHYYANKGFSPVLPTWEGKKQGDSIVLYRKSTAPNGVEGKFRLTFSNITAEGFHWIGEWVDEKEQIVYPTWRIVCRKKKI